MPITPSSPGIYRPGNALRAIVIAGLVAGFLDGAAASVQYYITTGNNPTRVFQFIASAVFGKSAFSGGLEMAAWGVLFHFLIALGFTVLFYILYPVMTRLARSRYLIGIIFGILVWVIMNLVVVPLSNAPQFPFQLKGIFIGLGLIILMIGLPISLIFHHLVTKKMNVFDIQ